MSERVERDGDAADHREETKVKMVNSLDGGEAELQRR